MTPSERDTATALPYLTADLPGIGGAIKRFDEDFVVEELPLYPACGEGTHTYFVVEKRGMPTLAAIRLIAKSLGRPPRDFGYSGLKDAHGVTRQTLSIEHVEPSRVESLELGRVKVLAVTRHTNKLKLGHLAGNRFLIRIRDASPTALTLARPIVEVLAARGLPNYFGPQRFGARGDNASIGKAVLGNDYDQAIALILGRPGPTDHGLARRARELFDAGDLEASAAEWGRKFPEQCRLCRTFVKTYGDAQKAWRAVNHTLRKLYINAFQSELFNRTLARRISAIDRLETGDIAWKHRNGACFRVEDAAVEQSRCDAFEISPTGPLFGRRMSEPSGEPGRIEELVLAEAGIARDQIRAKDGTKLDGARRPLRVPVVDPVVDAGRDDHGEFLSLTFSLAPGAYATSLTREICKTDSEDSLVDADSDTGDTG